MFNHLSDYPGENPACSQFENQVSWDSLLKGFVLWLSLKMLHSIALASSLLLPSSLPIDLSMDKRDSNFF